MRSQSSAVADQWQTWWIITGPKLPADEFRFSDRIVLAPLSDAAFEDSKKVRPPVMKMEASLDSQVVCYPPRDEVQSRHRLQIDVQASNADEASDTAQRIADRLLLSLSLSIPGRRYHAELRRLRRVGEQQEITAWSQSATIAMFEEPDPLFEADLTEVRALFSEIDKDSVAENAYIHLLTAWQLQSTAGAKPLQRSILQHYVLCVEAIVNGVMTSVRKDRADSIRQEERQFAAGFAESFSKRANKPEAIREASTELRKIGLINMLPSIATVSSILRISDDVKDQAINLYRFRSSNLSHPGRDRPDAFREWLTGGSTVDKFCLADVVARNFLAAYCRHSAGIG
ncbi:hypothetical protein LJR011_003490 [Agrobacterium tumefaciens]|uniref:hypothetical protein n=1 Tax=unclassified Agrobacterium TaxID=2632611 RepID=UPI00037EDE91|nr:MULTISPECIES: hypothetical protein [unclassified Agrobacterium]SNB56437.1 hypothetical protein SAMN05661103_1484 [Agrobacterium sp. 719_389]